MGFGRISHTDRWPNGVVPMVGDDERSLPPGSPERAMADRAVAEPNRRWPCGTGRRTDPGVLRNVRPHHDGRGLGSLLVLVGPPSRAPGPLAPEAGSRPDGARAPAPHRGRARARGGRTPVRAHAPWGAGASDRRGRPARARRTPREAPRGPGGAQPRPAGSAAGRGPRAEAIIEARSALVVRGVPLNTARPRAAGPEPGQTEGGRRHVGHEHLPRGDRPHVGHGQLERHPRAHPGEPGRRLHDGDAGGPAWWRRPTPLAPCRRRRPRLASRLPPAEVDPRRPGPPGARRLFAPPLDRDLALRAFERLEAERRRLGSERLAVQEARRGILPG